MAESSYKPCYKKIASKFPAPQDDDHLAGKSGGVAAMIITVLLILAASACSQPASWTDALESTSPPDPRSSQIGPRQAKAPQRDAGRDDRMRASTPATRETAPEESTEPFIGPALGNDVVLELSFEGEAGCLEGSVRCSVDGNYVGEVRPGRSIAIRISAGDHYFEGWDSRGGRWTARFRAESGQETKLPIRCADRQSGGDF